jgi:hypothetical protein
MHIALPLRMQSLRSKELTLLQTSRIRRREIRRVTRQVLEQGEVSIGQVSSGEGVALIVGFSSVGVGGRKIIKLNNQK